MQETKLTLTGIAGFCPEPAVWQLVADLCDIVQAHRSGAYLAPENIIADHYSFRVDDTGVEAQEFQAPETAATGQVTDAQCVWSMGALIYYCTLGRVVFGGHGSAYQRQHPDVALPVLPKTHRALTPVLHRCRKKAGRNIPVSPSDASVVRQSSWISDGATPSGVGSEKNVIIQ